MTALQSISDIITTGLNKKKPVERTVMVAIDLSKAFDTVGHEILITDISKLKMNDNIQRFPVDYFSGSRKVYIC